MALNDMTNLKLGQLGHIAGGNADNTTQTSLGATCRGSTGTATSMRADFRIGSATFINESGLFNGSAKGYFKCKVRNDVGEYMGGGQSGEYVSDYKVGINDANTYIYYISETNDGSLYESRIAQRSTNSADYNGEFELVDGSAGFGISHPYTDQDRVRYFGSGGQ